MTEFVPTAFDVPAELVGDGFRLVPLGPEHNERDYKAWTSSMDHIKATPGFDDTTWPVAMSLEENLGDLSAHAKDFGERTGFTYSVLDPSDDVIGCLYIYPSKKPDYDAQVRSWVRVSHANLDEPLWEAVSAWLASDWPFRSVRYAAR